LGKLKKKENCNYQHYNILSAYEHYNILSAYEVKDETSTSSTYVSLVFYPTVRSKKIIVKIKGAGEETLARKIPPGLKNKAPRRGEQQANQNPADHQTDGHRPRNKRPKAPDGLRRRCRHAWIGIGERVVNWGIGTGMDLRLEGGSCNWAIVGGHGERSGGCVTV
jgi:hypothetical protein